MDRANRQRQQSINEPRQLQTQIGRGGPTKAAEAGPERGKRTLVPSVVKY